ncbi:MAG: TolC family protein [Saprospiraceae bacterium]|nr:TolC family protein [Saprospiraceae bacterium]
MVKKHRFLFFIFFLARAGFSQDILTPEEAVNKTLENNFGIKIARQNISIATNNATKTAVGYNPTVNATAGASANVGSSTQKFGNGNENVVNNAVSFAGNANLSGSYTFYDEARATTLEQLKEVLNLSNLQLRQTIESNVLQLISRYYEVARLTASVDVLEQTLQVSNRRLERVQYQYEYGQGLRLDILNAEVDVQRDSINLINNQQLLDNSKRDLNVIMGVPIENPIDVDTSVIYQGISLENLRAGMSEQNVDLLLLEKNVDINRYDLKIIEAERKPRISATGSYSYNQQKNPPGAFITSSNNRGLNLGVNLSWSLVDGGLRKLREQNTEINLQTLQLQEEQLLQELDRDLINTWENYQNALYVLEAERKNLSTSELNFQRTEEQFNLGQSTSVEFRQAQLNLLNAATNYNNAKYDAKVIEVSLLQLAGDLLQ